MNLSSNFILLCLGFLMRHEDNNKMLISYGFNEIILLKSLAVSMENGKFLSNGSNH